MKNESHNSDPSPDEEPHKFEPDVPREPEDVAESQSADDDDFGDIESIPPEALEHLPPIPEQLHSAYEEGPFTKCSVCERLLLEQDSIYNVEKVLKHGDCIFEMALCMTCAQNLHKQYSKESRKALKKFFLDSYEPSLDTDSCHLCRAPSADGEDRVLTAGCARDRLVMPMVVVCNNCLERQQKLLSRETRDTFRDFVETNFPGVPAQWEPTPTVLA